MAEHFFDSREDFHYDNSGYYGYIVFNGDERTLNGLRNALGQGQRPHGLGWYRYGKSFRPANDGRMYDWYIRLHSGGNDKPPAHAVDNFLRSFLQPPAPAPQPPETQKLVQELLQDTLKHYEESVEELKQGLNELRSDVQANSAAQVELGAILEQGVANHAALEEARNELKITQEKLTNAEEDLTDAGKRIEHLDNELAHSGSGGLHDELKRVEKAKKKIEDERDGLKRERVSLRNSLKSAEKDKVYWKNQFDEVSEENGRLQDELAESHDADPEAMPVRNPDVDLETVIGATLPELRLVGDSWDLLKFGELNHGAVLRRLRSIVWDDQVPGSKVFEGADDWMELHIDRRLWRLYYCRKDSLVGDKVVAMIGKKGDQESKDKQWLRNNPPAVALKNEMKRRRSNL